MMKKKLFISMLFFVFVPTNAQTKQETMDFIASKFQKYLVSPRQFVSYSNGVFKYAKRNIEGTEDIKKQKITSEIKYIKGKNGTNVPVILPKTQYETVTKDINCGSIVYTIDLNNVTKVSYSEGISGIRKVNNYDRDGNFIGVVDKVDYVPGYFRIYGKGVLKRDFSNYACKDDEDKLQDDFFDFTQNDAIDLSTEEGLQVRMKKAFELLIKYNQKASDGGLFMD